MTHKSINTTRIYCQNVNGLDIGVRGGDVNTICTDILTTQSDIFLATETKICHQHNDIKQIIKKTTASILKHSAVVTASSKIKYKTYKKPGGTMIFTHGPTKGRLSKTGSDAYG